MLDAVTVVGLVEAEVTELLPKIDCVGLDEVGRNCVFHILEQRTDDEAYNLLLKLKAFNVSYNVIDVNTQTPLYYASRDGLLRCCQFLIQNGCALDHTDFISQTPLYYASREGHVHVIEWMLQAAGSDLANHKDDFQETCIFYALREANLAALQLLVKYTRLDTRNTRNESLVDIAKRIKPVSLSQKCLDVILYNGDTSILNILSKQMKRRVTQMREQIAQTISENKENVAPAATKIPNRLLNPLQDAQPYSVAPPYSNNYAAPYGAPLGNDIPCETQPTYQPPQPQYMDAKTSTCTSVDYNSPSYMTGYTKMSGSSILNGSVAPLVSNNDTNLEVSTNNQYYVPLPDDNAPIATAADVAAIFPGQPVQDYYNVQDMGNQCEMTAEEAMPANEGECCTYALRVYDEKVGYRNMETVEAKIFAEKMKVPPDDVMMSYSLVINLEEKAKLEVTREAVSYIGDCVRDRWELAFVDLVQLLKAAGSDEMKEMIHRYGSKIMSFLRDHNFHYPQSVFAFFEKCLSQHRTDKNLSLSIEDRIREEFYQTAFLMTQAGRYLNADVEQQRLTLGKVVRPMHKKAVKYLKIYRKQIL